MRLNSSQTVGRALERGSTSIPLWIRIAYTLYLCALVPVYWTHYGPANFLWFCDFAALLAGVGLWLGNPLLISTCAVASTLPQFLWAADFLTGGHLSGMSAYMFNPAMPLYLRALSTFHLWLPVLLLRAVWRMGYDRRALAVQSVLATGLLVASFVLTNPAHPPAFPQAAVNVNRVYGPAVREAQHWMPPLLYLSLQILLYPVCVYLPTHLVFLRVFRRARTGVHDPIR